jgi:hypothetical protein
MEQIEDDKKVSLIQNDEFFVKSLPSTSDKNVNVINHVQTYDNSFNDSNFKTSVNANQNKKQRKAVIDYFDPNCGSYKKIFVKKK